MVHSDSLLMNLREPASQILLDGSTRFQDFQPSAIISEDPETVNLHSQPYKSPFLLKQLNNHNSNNSNSKRRLKKRSKNNQSLKRRRKPSQPLSLKTMKTRSLSKRSSILLINCLQAHSTLMTGREDSRQPRMRPL